jgi:hypothetical protein
MHSTNLDYIFWAKTADDLIAKLEDTH